MHKYHTKNTTICTTKYYKIINVNISNNNNNLSLNNKIISNNNKCTVSRFNGIGNIKSLSQIKSLIRRFCSLIKHILSNSNIYNTLQ